MNTRWLPLLPVLVVTSLACDSPFDLDPALLPLVRTDRSAYVAAEADGYLRFDVGFEFVNRTEVVLRIDTECWSAAIDRLDGETWVEAQDRGPCEQIVYFPVILNPGERFSETARAYLDATLRGSTFRLRFDVTRSGDLVPLGLRTSNTFSIEPP